MAFLPNQAPHGDAEALRAYVESELQRLALSLQEGSVQFMQLAVTYVAPNKPRDGLVVFADGTSWNPGTGRGVYVYSSGAWVKL